MTSVETDSPAAVDTAPPDQRLPRALLVVIAVAVLAIGGTARRDRQARDHDREAARRVLPAAHAAPPPGRRADGQVRGRAREGTLRAQPRDQDVHQPEQGDHPDGAGAPRARWLPPSGTRL